MPDKKLWVSEGRREDLWAVEAVEKPDQDAYLQMQYQNIRKAVRLFQEQPIEEQRRLLAEVWDRVWLDLDTMEDIGLELSRHIPKMGTIWAPSKNKALTKLT